MKEKSKYNILIDFIGDGEVEKAIRGLIKIAQSVKNVKAEDTATILLGRFKKNQKKETLGVIKEDESGIEQNKIAEGVLREIRNLENYEMAISAYEGESNSLKLSEEDVFRITKTAIIVLELEKIKEEVYTGKWEERGKALKKLFKYSDHSTIRLAKEIFTFLSSVGSLTRSGMDVEMAYTLESLVIHFFPHIEKESEEEFEKLAGYCIHLGDVIFYDSAIYLEDLKVGVYGLQILKWIYFKGERRDNKLIMNKVRKVYKELEVTLKRPERDDLEMASELLQVFKDDLDIPGLNFPSMPKHLLELV